MSGEYAGNGELGNVHLPGIIMLKHEAMVADEWHDNGIQNLITVALCIQIAKCS
jgi:hypothetical protein